ncbi:unnamed protein product [Diplocarpon coronariae]
MACSNLPTAAGLPTSLPSRVRSPSIFFPESSTKFPKAYMISLAWLIVDFFHLQTGRTGLRLLPSPDRSGVSPTRIRRRSKDGMGRQIDVSGSATPVRHSTERMSRLIASRPQPEAGTLSWSRGRAEHGIVPVALISLQPALVASIRYLSFAEASTAMATGWGLQFRRIRHKPSVSLRLRTIYTLHLSRLGIPFAILPSTLHLARQIVVSPFSMNINEVKRGGGIVLPFFNRDRRSSVSAVQSRPSSSLKSNRLPFIGWIPNHVRNPHVLRYLGTTMFLMFAFAGTQVALLAHPAGSSVVGAPSDPSQLMYISLCFGFSLAVNAWVFFRISGGLFNPAVTLGMCLIGALPYVRGVCLTVAQILGGITAAAIVSALLPGELTVRTNLGGGTTVVQGLFIEMFLSALLVFTIFMLAAEKHKGTFIAPVGIGLALFVAELMGVYFTGGSVNPARSFGPSVVSHKFHSYHWIYWVGPILGAIVASGFFLLMKMLEYETANPGQDSSAPEGEHFNPDLATANPRVSFAPDEYAMAEEGRSHGTPVEYGTHSRPFSASPAPPHPNDQFRGLADGGMHGDDVIKPVHTGGSASDLTLASEASSPRQAAPKPAIKSGSRGGNISHAHESSVRSNTYNNRIITTGDRNSEEFNEKC